MKRIRWSEPLQHYEWDDGPDTVLRSDVSNLFTGIYRGADWAAVKTVRFAEEGQIWVEVQETPRMVTMDVQFPRATDRVAVYRLMSDGKWTMTWLQRNTETDRELAARATSGGTYLLPD